MNKGNCQTVRDNDSAMSHLSVRVVGDKRYDPLKIHVSDEEIISFLDRWLVNSRSLKFNKEAIILLNKLLPHFSYEGKLVRGLFTPYVEVKHPGVDQWCIESWSKSAKGIKNVEKFMHIVFGSTSVKDNTIETYTPDEFIEWNTDIEPEFFDKKIKGKHVGIDLVALAGYVNYRPDFLEKLDEAEEILVLQKVYGGSGF